MKYLLFFLIISLTSCITNDNTTQYSENTSTNLSTSNNINSGPEPIENNIQYPDWYHIRHLTVDNNKQAKVTALVKNDQIIDVYVMSSDGISLAEYSWVNNTIINNEPEYKLYLTLSVPTGTCCIQFPPDPEGGNNSSSTHSSNFEYNTLIRFTESHEDSYANPNGLPCINGVCPE